MSFSAAQLHPLLLPYHHLNRWVVGYSGGVDSTALLVVLQQYLASLKTDTKPALLALHINHQLQDAAPDWAGHCAEFCDASDISFRALTVTVDVSGQGPEAAAREARYSAFHEFLQPDDALLLAHHRDDQAETLMLNLMRGSGHDGLAGMPGSRRVGAARLLRPLLDVSRAELVAFAREQQLRWMEDPTNSDTAFSRNFVRHKVLPLLQTRWPQASAALARSADVLGQEAALLQEIATQDLEAAPGTHRDALSISYLLRLSLPRRRNLLRYWLGQFGLRPRHSQLRELEAGVMGAAEDAAPELKIADHILRRHRDTLFCLREFPQPQAFDWLPAQASYIEGWGTLVAQAAARGGIKAAPRYRVQFRAGGERAQPLGRMHSTTLKKLFQAHDVPVWERDIWPLIYCDGELAAVPGLFICEGYEAAAGQDGWYLKRDPINCAPL